LLALKENRLDQAEQFFAQAYEQDPHSYEACHNLFCTRLSLGRIVEAADVVSQAMHSVQSPQEQRRLLLLHLLLRTFEYGKGDETAYAGLAQLSADNEERLLRLIGRIGHLDTAETLLKALASARPESAALADAGKELALVRGRELVHRGDWLAA